MRKPLILYLKECLLQHAVPVAVPGVVILLAVFGALPGMNPPAAFAEPPLKFSVGDLLLPKKTIPFRKFGVNGFVNDPRFGSIAAQFNEMKGTLGIQYVRVLFSWNDDIQSSRGATPFWGFYDEIIQSLPRGMKALVVLTDVPTWMESPNSWIDGNPRTSFVEYWVKPVLTRYGRSANVEGFQIWNEPNNPSFPDNRVLDVLTNPAHYVELIAGAATAVRTISPRKRVVMGATTAINQNFPETIEYNNSLLDLGIEAHTDFYTLHYYGTQLENVYRPGGVSDFLPSISKPIWITESGSKGTSDQEGYVRRVWPFLSSLTPLIKRFYFYQFTDAAPLDENYGMRTLSPERRATSLYQALRTNAARRARQRKAAARRRR